MKQTDVIIIGAGAAGLMCAIEAGKRGRKVLVLDHANKVGKKILMSGGGRCNFTNELASPQNYLCRNPHFCKSALSRYTQWDFIALVKKHKIPFHEKTLGQLFCDNKAKDIVEMLLKECQNANVEIRLETSVNSVTKSSERSFKLNTSAGDFKCQSLVIASGGLSIPTMGATAFGYKIAEQFNIKVWPTRAGLVPLTLQPEDKTKFAELSGVSLACVATNDKISFKENLLFTHRGLSGPAILQISSYWQAGEVLEMDLLPENNLFEQLKSAQKTSPKKNLRNYLADFLPKRAIEILLEENYLNKSLADFSHKLFEKIAHSIHQWKIKPNGTEGYRTAEVTLGGVDTDALSSKTMEANSVSGLYFIGEVVEVSGWLGGYNFQWAWSSGWAAGQVV